MPQFRSKYQYTRPYSSGRHDWIVVGARGAIHLHISEPPNGDPQYSYSAGLETHYRSPPDYMADQAPSHDECWVLHCPCWHDGTSLYAQERYLPIWMADRHDHEGMFRRLEREYAERFPRVCEPVEV